MEKERAVLSLDGFIEIVEKLQGRYLNRPALLIFLNDYISEKWCIIAKFLISGNEYHIERKYLLSKLRLMKEYEFTNGMFKVLSFEKQKLYFKIFPNDLDTYLRNTLELNSKRVSKH